MVLSTLVAAGGGRAQPPLRTCDDFSAIKPVLMIEFNYGHYAE